MINEFFKSKGFSRKLDKHSKTLKASLIDTILGQMIIVSDDKELYFLDFMDRENLQLKLKNLQIKTDADIIVGVTDPIKSITSELKSYFEGLLKEFKTPIHLLGSPFQKLVWNALMHIPYGETKSYAAQATFIEKHTAYRAVANANGANKISIVIPCHRIINSNGSLGGYGGGIKRKQWLIDHEKRYIK